MEKTGIITEGIEFIHTVEECAPCEILATRHCHDEYEILYVASGKGSYIIEGHEFPLAPRTVVLIKPFEYHCVRIEETSVYERYVIHFSASKLGEEACALLERILGESSERSGCFYPPANMSQQALSVFDRFESAAGLTEADRGLYMRLLLTELMIFLSVASGQKIIHDEIELGARVIKYINEYIDKKLSLDVLAKKFFVSKYYLCRAFKRYSGVSIHSYINHKRVVFAKQLIDGGETASGAAYKVGFCDYSAFYRAYVKIMGAPPTMEIRKRENPDNNGSDEPCEG